MTRGDGFTLLSDEELETAFNRAWREAARCWQDYRNAPGDTPDDRTVRQMLHDEAWSAEHYWRRLYDERKRRA